MRKTINFTKKGYEDLKLKYQKILSTRLDAIKTLSRARELGDLSENGFYKAAKGKVNLINSQLRRLDSLIKQAIIPQKPEDGIIGIGSKVTVNDGNQLRNFYIVGQFEADPLKDKISEVSPVGKALIGKKVGDSVKIKTPNSQVEYKILQIK